MAVIQVLGINNEVLANSQIRHLIDHHRIAWGFLDSMVDQCSNGLCQCLKSLLQKVSGYVLSIPALANCINLFNTKRFAKLEK